MCIASWRALGVTYVLFGIVQLPAPQHTHTTTKEIPMYDGTWFCSFSLLVHRYLYAEARVVHHFWPRMGRFQPIRSHLQSTLNPLSSTRRSGVGLVGGGWGAAAAHSGEPPEDGDMPGAGRNRLAAADRGAGPTREDLQPREFQGTFGWCCCIVA